MYEPYRQYYTGLQDTGKYRKLPSLFTQDQQLNFSTNDYLGLSKRKELLDAAITAAQEYGVGSTGSRLLSGSNQLFEALESRIALDKGTESALIFNSGFQANISVLASLLDSSILKERPIVFFDKCNHFSLYQAVLLSGAELVRYHHNDMDHLSALLMKFAKYDRPKFIVTETIFGMDGEILPIHDVLNLSKQHSAFLYLDEAHATGVVGNRGYGLSTTVDLKSIPHLIMGTFSKALGCSGAYIACSEVLKNYLINKTAGFIYSTANSPMVIGAAFKAWDMVGSFDNERSELLALADNLREILVSLGFNTGASSSHIIPIILGKEELAMQAQTMLQEKGIIVSAIRPPTVPPSTSRLRIALTINHTAQDVEQLIMGLKTL